MVLSDKVKNEWPFSFLDLLGSVYLKLFPISQSLIRNVYYQKDRVEFLG